MGNGVPEYIPDLPLRVAHVAHMDKSHTLKNYKFQEIAFSLDELIVINASRIKSINEFAFMISDLVNEVFIPLCAGGGIRKMEDAELLFNSGADKILVNTILKKDPKLVKNLIKK